MCVIVKYNIVYNFSAPQRGGDRYCDVNDATNNTVVLRENAKKNILKHLITAIYLLKGSNN